MNKKILKGALITSFIGGVFIGMAPTALADRLSTDTTIGFKSDSHVPPDVNPEPDTLALLWAPRRFDFGQDHVAGAAGSAVEQKTNVNLTGEEGYVTVKDSRMDSNSHVWKLDMKASSLITSDANQKKLSNATLTLVNKAAIEYIGSASPELAISKGQVDAAIKTKAVTDLPADDTTQVTIASAANSQRKAWSIRVDDLTLKVPIADVTQAISGERYNGTITWSLSDTI